MKAKLLIALMSTAVVIAGSSVAFSVVNQNKGAENIKIDGGKKGKVPFPHRQHQERLVDCKICHAIFPQNPGSIKKLKAQGKLKKKYVMNKLCTKCHKETKKTGRKSGPTRCSKCHIKKKT